MAKRVGIAEYRIGGRPEVFKATGLGSCLAVGLYDAELGLGGLAHALLPGRRKEGPLAGSAKFVEDAIHEMYRSLLGQGADKGRLVAKLAGGANMFETEFLSQVNGIGARSAHSARTALAGLGIPLVAEDVGGNRGRTVEFDLATGLLIVYCARDASILRL